MPTKILLVDDIASTRRSLRASLERDADVRVCGEAKTIDVAVKMVRRLSPDVIVVSFSLPSSNGIEVAREIRKIKPDTYIVLYARDPNPQLFDEARRVGVDHVLIA